MCKPRVFIGMSGGVDSSVSAALLKEQGYDVVGVYMKNWTRDVAGVECPWRRDVADARSVAALLDIDFKIFDFENEYKQRVVDYMVAEYRAGRTPNPDIMCNQEVKFKLFLETSLEEGADLIATGHYARIQALNTKDQASNGVINAKTPHLYTGTDESKDQSYFLYRVTREALEKTLFPLGGLSKDEVRQKAAELNLPTADKPDSQGICFIGEVDIRRFLQEYIETGPGQIKHAMSGEVIGEHEGAELYTIGQRRGLNVGGVLSNSVRGGLPLYVSGKDMSDNTVYVTENLTSLMQDELVITDLHWINDPPHTGYESYRVRTRHRGRLTHASVTEIDENSATIKLADTERALTAGQSAVVYKETGAGMVVLGGGIIVQ